MGGVYFSATVQCTLRNYNLFCEVTSLNSTTRHARTTPIAQPYTQTYKQFNLNMSVNRIAVAEIFIIFCLVVGGYS